jgi:chemotaxis protein MotA
MFAIIGIVIVIGAILGGFLMEKGPIAVLIQPAELIIIAGAGFGTILIANPLPVVIKLFKCVLGILSGSRYTKAFYLENLKMFNEIFSYARKNGLPKLEGDVDDPHKSQIFSKYPNFLKDHHAVDFICDSLRMFISSGTDPFELDQMMELDMEVHHHEVGIPVGALSSTADALPGIGIVAAVLGIVITMGALGGPPEEIGHKSPPRWSELFSESCFVTAFWGPLRRTCQR